MPAALDRIYRIYRIFPRLIIGIWSLEFGVLSFVSLGLMPAALVRIFRQD